MDYIKLIYNNNYGIYNHTESTALKMDLLARFFAYDISWHGISFVRNWILNPQYTESETNITILKKHGNCVVLRDLYQEEDDKDALCTITTLQFFQLLQAWEEICESKPKEVTIIYENGEFSMVIKQ